MILYHHYSFISWAPCLGKSNIKTVYFNRMYFFARTPRMPPRVLTSGPKPCWRNYTMLCYAMLCYAMLCYAMLCYAMLVTLYSTPLYSNTQSRLTVSEIPIEKYQTYKSLEASFSLFSSVLSTIYPTHNSAMIWNNYAFVSGFHS